MRRRVPFRTSIVACSVAAGLCIPGWVSAQTNKEFVRNLFNLTVLPEEAIDPATKATVEQVGPASADAIARFVSAALFTAPTPSSSAGFSFVTDSATGERRVKSDSFGPTFADRPLTNGKGVANFGFNVQYGSTDFEGAFGTTDGRDTGLPLFDNPRTYTDGVVEFVTRRAFLRARSQTFNTMVSYGVSEQLDLGVLVPIVSLKVTGSIDDQFDETKQFNAGLNPGQISPSGISEVRTASSQSAAGIGDVTIRTKYSFVGDRSEGAAIAADVRIPIGNEDEMLGTGKASLKLQALLLKSGVGPASIHGNVGFTVGGLSDEINYVFGADAALLSRKTLTVSASLLGRTLLAAALPTPRTTVALTDPGIPNRLPASTFSIERYVWEKANVALLQLATGFKYQVSGQWLLSASVLVPLNQRGFQAGLSPVLGLEKTWR